jgi:dTDP-4-amino-4,6-dideoxygalactose transaminase
MHRAPGICSSIAAATAGLVPNIRPYFEVDAETLARVAELLASGRVTNHGPQVQAFQASLAEYLRVRETVAVGSGSDALLLSLKALGVSGGAAILPAYTYVATLNAVVQAGLTPVFCDIDPKSFTLDPAHLAALLPRLRAVACLIPVNVFGVPPDLATLDRLARSAGAKVLYDNAHGFGTEDNEARVAPEPDVQIFSFHATKTLPAVEGGLIVANDPGVSSLAKRLRHHGLGSRPAEMIPGFNSKMDELRAVIGLQSLRHFPETLARRRAYGRRLLSAFQRFPECYVPQVTPPAVRTNFQNLGICCPAAEQVGLSRVIELFGRQGVGVRSYFDPPLNHFPGFDQGPQLPVTQRIWRTLISVPIHSRMSEDTLEQITGAAAAVAEELERETRL